MFYKKKITGTPTQVKAEQFSAETSYTEPSSAQLSSTEQSSVAPSSAEESSVEQNSEALQKKLHIHIHNRVPFNFNDQAKKEKIIRIAST